MGDEETGRMVIGERGMWLLILLLFLPGWAWADGGLVAQMELHIRVQAMSREAAKEARAKVDSAIKQTSLWKSYHAARKELAAVMDAHCKPSRGRMRPDTDLTTQWTLRCGTLGRRETMPVFVRMGSARADLDALRERFVDKVYAKEMSRRLKKIKAHLTDELKRELERLRKKHTAI